MFEKLNVSKENPEAIETESEKCISEESFNEQFANDLVISNEKGEVMYTKVTPEIIKFDSPVIYVGGFVQGKETYRSEIEDLCNSGREVIFTNPIKGFDVSEDETCVEFKNKYNVPDVTMSKMAAVEEIIKAEGLEGAELVSHSQGGLIATLVCARNPGLAKNLVIQNPAGFTEPRSFTQQFVPFVSQLYENFKRGQSLGRVKKDQFTREEWKEEYQGKPGVYGRRAAEGPEVVNSMKRAGTSFVKEAKRSESSSIMPLTVLWRLRNEVPSISSFNLGPVLRDIQERNLNEEDSATTVTMVLARSDKLFTHDTYEQVVKIIEDEENLEDVTGPELGEYVNHLAYFVEKDASHSAPGLETPGLLRPIINS